MGRVGVDGRRRGRDRGCLRANLAPLGSGDSDEPVYVYQARLLAEGHLTLAARTHGEFFHPWLFGQRGDRLFSQYQPGWPSVIAFAHVVGDERVALVLAAVAVVAATWFLGEQIERGSGVYAALLLVLSPIFIVHAGLYLSYLWTAALVAGALGCVIAGVRRARPAMFVAGGALFGAAVLTRPLDAFIVAVLAAIYAIVTDWNDRAALGRAGLWTGVGGLPFVAVAAIYNVVITGSVFRFPLQAAEPRDTFGFGPRTMVAEFPTVDYTAHRAWEALLDNVSSVPHWFAGGGIGFVLVVAAIVVHRRQRETWLLVAAILAFPVAYFFWWATALSAKGAAHGLGPHYYIPAFTFLAVLAGRAIQDLVRRSWVLAAAGAARADRIARGDAVGDRQRARDDASPATECRAAPGARARRRGRGHRADPHQYTLVDFGFLVGDPRLTGRVLYATDRGPASADLARIFPKRRLYQFVQRTEPGHALLDPSYIVEPMQVRTGSEVTLDLTARSPAGAAVRRRDADGRRPSGRAADAGTQRARGERRAVHRGAGRSRRARPPRPGRGCSSGASITTVRCRSTSRSGAPRTAPPARTCTDDGTTWRCGTTGSRSRRRDCSTTVTTSARCSGCGRTSTRGLPRTTGNDLVAVHARSDHVQRVDGRRDAGLGRQRRKGNVRGRGGAVAYPFRAARTAHAGAGREERLRARNARAPRRRARRNPDEVGRGPVRVRGVEEVELAVPAASDGPSTLPASHDCVGRSNSTGGPVSERPSVANGCTAMML